jgi:hypothetical protein
MGRKKIQGVGDAIESVTSFFGIKPCDACNKRKELLNINYPIRLKPRQMTDEELTEWRHFQKIRTLRLDNNQRKWLCKIYSDVFRVPYFEPCVNCDGSPYLKMIERMDKEESTYI